MADKHIPTAIYYPKPLSTQKAFLKQNINTPVSRRLANEVLSLPINAYLNEKNIEEITTEILDFVSLDDKNQF